jgi:hypothetical protein
MLIALPLAVVGPLVVGWLFAKPYNSFGVFRP